MTHVVGKLAPSTQRLKQLGHYASIHGDTEQRNNLSSLCIAMYVNEQACIG